MNMGSRGPERGDSVRAICGDCGEYFSYTYGKDHDPPRSSTICPDCYPDYQRARNAMVAGSWRINNEDVRDEMVELIETETGYETYVKERVGDIFVYDPADVGYEGTSVEDE